MNGNSRIMVADDTKNIRILLTKCLEMEGYAVDTACDGEQAVELTRKNTYDLIFLDIKMPFYSGTEVLKHLRENGIQTPVIIITAYATVKNAVECTRLGAVAYLQKPFTPEKVRAVLNELVEAGHVFNVSGEIVRIRSLIDEGRSGEAIALLKGMLPANPLDPNIYQLLAIASKNLDRPDDAAKYFSIYTTII